MKKMGILLLPRKMRVKPRYLASKIDKGSIDSSIKYLVLYRNKLVKLVDKSNRLDTIEQLMKKPEYVISTGLHITFGVPQVGT